MSPITLAFEDAAIERQFLDDYADSVRLQVRGIWIMAILVLLAFAGVDPPGDVGFYTRVVRYGFGLPITLFGLAVSFAPMKTFRRVWAATMCVSGFAGLGLIPVIPCVLALTVPSWRLTDDLWTFFLTMVASVMGVLLFCLGTLRFFQATATAAAYVVLYSAVIGALGMSARGLVCAVISTGCATLGGAFGAYRVERYRRRLFLEQRQLAAERAKSESLLRNVLPLAIAERLKSDPSHIADGFAEVTILFADIVGFTDLSARLSPSEVVAMLNRLFTAFDDLADKHGLEKIKTIGDAYMVVGGLPDVREDHAVAVVSMALEMREAVGHVSGATGHTLKVRIGVNTGPVVAGVIGKKKFAYDLWGDAVNTASRMESHGQEGEIQITESTRTRVKDTFDLEARGLIHVKGKGDMPAWLVRGPKGA